MFHFRRKNRVFDRRVQLHVDQMEPRRVLANLFWVNSVGDQPDPTPNNGIQDDVDPVTPGDQFTLRGAIQTANSKQNAAAGDPDQIRFNKELKGTLFATFCD